MTRTRLLHCCAIALSAAMPVLLLGCPKKPPPPAVEDAAPPDPVVLDAGVTQLEPLDEDSGPEAAAPAPVRHGGGGGGLGANAARIKQCCNAMRKQATGMGASPEANIVLGLATQCDLIALQAAGGTAPEFGAFRQMISGRTLPAACSGM